MKIQKHSATLSLQVIVGLKRTLPLVCLAMLFLLFLWCVSDRLSCCSLIWRGLYLGANLWVLARVSNAHAWGFMHPPALLVEQSGQVQFGDRVCFLFGCCSLSFFDSFTPLPSLPLFHRLSGPPLLNSCLHLGTHLVPPPLPPCVGKHKAHPLSCTAPFISLLSGWHTLSLAHGGELVPASLFRGCD